MGRIIGWILIALAAFMFVGYLGAGVSGPAALFALLVAVVLPAAGGFALVTGRLGAGRGRLNTRREELRRDTLQSEILRLAGTHGGRITIVEVVSALAITPEEAKESLDALAVRGLADFEVTDSGIVVYVFHDVQHLGDKSEARGLLE
jgi:hypothetical protein